MEWMLLILALVLLLCVPLAVILSVAAWRRQNRVERRLESAEIRLRAFELAARAGTAANLEPDAETTPVPGPSPVARGAARRDLESLVGGQWLTWIGVLTLFFGTAFFLAYDLGDHPVAGGGQIAAGLLVALLFLGAGAALIRRAQRFLGQGLLGGGVALLFLAAYASYGFHHLVPAWVVYPFILTVSVIGARLALAQDSLMVASLTLTGALVTPLLLPGEGEDASRLFFAYLVAVNLGTVIIAIRRSWGILPLGGLLGTIVLVLRWWDDVYRVELRWGTLAGVGLLWLLYALVPLLSALPGRVWNVARGLLVLAAALGFDLFLYELLDPGLIAYRGAAASTLALVYLAGARTATVLSSPKPGVLMTRYTGIALLALAAPIQFDLVGVTMAWTVLAGALLWAGVRFDSGGHRAWAAGILAAAGLRVLFLDISRVSADEPFRAVLNPEFLACVLFIAAAGWMARLFSRLPADTWERRVATPLVLVAASVLLWRITTQTHAIFEARELTVGVSQDLAYQLTLSLIWAVYAGGLILSGFVFRFRPVRLLGVVILGLLVLKVFVLDMQELERGYRIASFVGVGVLLLVISVMYQRERSTGGAARDMGGAGSGKTSAGDPPPGNPDR